MASPDNYTLKQKTIRMLATQAIGFIVMNWGITPHILEGALNLPLDHPIAPDTTLTPGEIITVIGGLGGGFALYVNEVPPIRDAIDFLI